MKADQWRRRDHVPCWAGKRLKKVGEKGKRWTLMMYDTRARVYGCRGAYTLYPGLSPRLNLCDHIRPVTAHVVQASCEACHYLHSCRVSALDCHPTIGRTQNIAWKLQKEEMGMMCPNRYGEMTRLDPFSNVTVKLT